MIQKVHTNLLLLVEPANVVFWNTFVLAFHWTLWLSLLLLSLGTSIMLWLFFKNPKQPHDVEFLEAITISISSFFGMAVTSDNDLLKDSIRTLMFIIFIFGSLFFYVYNGFLTSVLTVPADYRPFNSPEGVLKTNYR